MTINAPASLLLPLRARRRGAGRARTALRGTVQNDILKEYIARGNYIYPPRPSMRLTTDLFAYAAERIPSWNTISISGYHIREAGSTGAGARLHARERDRLRAGRSRRGLSPDEFGARLSFFFNAHNHFFQEVAKFRAARRLWATIMRDRFGATNPKALAPASTPRRAVDADRPAAGEQHRPRRHPGALGGRRRRAEPARTFDEALALPSEHAARIALRTQQILAAEGGATDTADPLGGSLLHRGAHRRARAARTRADRADRRARRRRGGGRAGLRP